MQIADVRNRLSGRLAENSNVPLRPRVRSEESSVLAIREEMPAVSDSWIVDSIAQYRCVYGTEQWLVKWKGYGEDRNTWEPWHNLYTDDAQAEAVKVREAALPHNEDGLAKFTVVTLKAVLCARSLDTSGSKADLVSRLAVALRV